MNKILNKTLNTEEVFTETLGQHQDKIGFVTLSVCLSMLRVATRPTHLFHLGYATIGYAGKWGAVGELGGRTTLHVCHELMEGYG